MKRELSSKQRAYLKGLAAKLEPVLQVGKNGVTPELTQSADEVLEARELIKITVLNNCMENIKDVSDKISERTKSSIVHVIGKKIVLYREAKEKPEIKLPER